MKTNLLLLMAFSLFMFSCSESENRDEAMTDDTNVTSANDRRADTSRPVMYFTSTMDKSIKGILSGEVISLTDAKKYIKAYRNENNAETHPLKTSSGAPLNGFVIRKGVLDSLLDQPGADGVRIYLGKDPNVTDPHRYTLVLVATKRNSKEFEHDITNLYFQHVNPCPDHCATNIDYEH